MKSSACTRRKLVTMAGASAFIAALGPNSAARRAGAVLADRYDVIDIGITSPDLEHFLSFIDMNENGVVVGNKYVSPTKIVPWIFHDGALTELDTGEFGARVSCITPDGVMGGRELLGWSDDGSAYGRPVIWIDGEQRVMPYPAELDRSAKQGRILDMNADHDAVGAVWTEGDVPVPVVWRNGIAELLATRNGDDQGIATHINDGGTIIGDISSDDRNWGGAIWDQRGLRLLTYTNPPGIRGLQTFGFDDLDERNRALGAFYLANGGRIPCYVDLERSTAHLVEPDVDTDVAAYISCSGGEDLFGGAMVNGDESHALIWKEGERIELAQLIRRSRGLTVRYLGKINSDGVLGGIAIDDDGAVHAVQIVPT